MESKRQKQVAETIRRNFSVILQEEGGYIYGPGVMVTVTSVLVSPDLALAKIYLSVYNTENKQAVLLQLQEHIHKLRQGLAHRIRKHVRRIPVINLYEDDTLDEMYRLNSLFNKLDEIKEKGEGNPDDLPAVEGEG